MKLFQNPIVVGVLAVLAVLLLARNAIAPLWQSLVSPRVRPAAAVTPAPAPAAASVAPAIASAPVAATHEVPRARAAQLDEAQVRSQIDRWVAVPRRDPFQTPLTSTNRISAGDVLSLTAIWRQTGSRLAVVNKRVVKEGDTILGFTVRSIEADRVWVDGNAGREALQFKFFRPKEPVENEPLSAGKDQPARQPMNSGNPSAPKNPST